MQARYKILSVSTNLDDDRMGIITTLYVDGELIKVMGLSGIHIGVPIDFARSLTIGDVVKISIEKD